MKTNDINREKFNIGIDTYNDTMVTYRGTILTPQKVTKHFIELSRDLLKYVDELESELVRVRGY